MSNKPKILWVIVAAIFLLQNIAVLWAVPSGTYGLTAMSDKCGLLTLIPVTSGSSVINYIPFAPPGIINFQIAPSGIPITVNSWDFGPGSTGGSTASYGPIPVTFATTTPFSIFPIKITNCHADGTCLITQTVAQMVPIQLKSIDFVSQGKSNNNEVINKKNDDWTKDKFADEGTPITAPEWQDPNYTGTPKINDPAAYLAGTKPSMTVVLKTGWSGSATLQVKDDAGTVLMTKNVILNPGTNSLKGLDWNIALDDKIRKKTYNLDWYLSLDGGITFTKFETTHNEICTLWAKSITKITGVTFAATAKRVDWSATKADGASSETGAAIFFQSTIATSPGYNNSNPALNASNTNPSIFLDSGETGDCLTLSALAVGGLAMTGIHADLRAAFPTNDKIAKKTSCRGQVTKFFTYKKQQFVAKLIYTDNDFEGFFTVGSESKGTISGYTIYTPTGPYTDQTYYYLDVLTAFAQGVQYWVWDGTKTKAGITVIGGNRVPEEANVPVPTH